MEWSSPILYPHRTFIWICLFVLSKSCSGTGSGGSSISTSSVGPDPSCPESQESSDQILLLEMRMMMRQKSLPSSQNCQSSVACSSLKCGLYEREYSVKFPQFKPPQFAWRGRVGLRCLRKFSSFFRIVKQNLKLLETQLTIIIGI